MAGLENNIRFLYSIISIIVLYAVTIISRGFIPSDKFSKKKGTHWTTMSILVSQVFMIITCVIESVLFDAPINRITNYVGITLLIIVLIITYVANKALGEYYSPKIEVKKKHKLVDFSIYKYIRHPMDLAGILFMIALPLTASTLFALIWIIPYSVLIGFKIKYEEAILSKGLKGYKAYMKKTKRLIPYVF